MEQEVHYKYCEGADTLIAPPAKQSNGAAGFDIRANLRRPDRELGIFVPKGRIVPIPTGLCLSLPLNVVCDIRSRSGLALNHGLIVLNSPGTIDSDYRGEVSVILINHGLNDYLIKHGERVAQLVFLTTVNPKFLLVNNLERTTRGDFGFGSTGVD